MRYIADFDITAPRGTLPVQLISEMSRAGWRRSIWQRHLIRILLGLHGTFLASRGVDAVTLREADDFNGTRRKCR